MTRPGRGGNAGWEQRRDAALKLRLTCTGCGAGPLPLVPASSGRGRTPAKCECGGTGLSIVEVGKRLGLPASTISHYVNDPDRTRARAKKAEHRLRNAGNCAGCNGPTDSKDVYRCGWCQRGEVSPYLRENSPTGFRERVRTDCGAPDCDRPRAAGRHVCEPCAPLYDRIRAELAEEAQRARRRKPRFGRGRTERLPSDFDPHTDAAIAA